MPCWLPGALLAAAAAASGAGPVGGTVGSAAAPWEGHLLTPPPPYSYPCPNAASSGSVDPIAPAPGLRTPPRSIPRGSAQPTRGRESAVPPSLWGAGVEEQQRATHSSWLQLRGPQGVRYSVSFGLGFFFFFRLLIYLKTKKCQQRSIKLYK